MKPSDILGEPKHLAEIIFYDISAYDRSVSERRAVFYKEIVKWKEHPWGRDRDGGADFFNEWTLESRGLGRESWGSDGRSGQGFDSLTLDEWQLDKAAAVRRAVQLATSDFECAEKRATQLRERLEALQALAT